MRWMPRLTVAAGLLFAAVGMPDAAFAQTLPLDQCDITQNGLLPNYLCNPSLNIYYAVSNTSPPDTSPHDAVRLDPGSPAAPIDYDSLCYYLTNNGTSSIFVPFKTPKEWTAFLNAAKSGSLSATIKTNTCAREWAPPVSDFPPDTTVGDSYYCGNPQISQGPTPAQLPYAPTNTVVPGQSPYNTAETVQYQCTCANNAQWTETVTQGFTAGNLIWTTAGTPVYSGNVPLGCNPTDLCAPPIFGSCEWGKPCPAANPPGSCLDNATPSNWSCIGCDGPGADDIKFTCTLGAQHSHCHRLISTYCLPQNC